MKVWYRDMVIANFSPEYVVNADLLEKIQKKSTDALVEKMLSNIDAIEQAERNILSNANTRISLDALVLTIFGDKN
jgi:hypothetical protein